MMLQYLSPAATSTEIRRWNRNGNALTLAAYLKQKVKEQQRIIAYLGGKWFYLVHHFRGDNAHDEVRNIPIVEPENHILACWIIVGYTKVLSMI